MQTAGIDRASDIFLLNKAIEWLTELQDESLDESHQVKLITVVRRTGVAPRKPGAMMLIHPDGRFEGSVSGGCIEDDLLRLNHIGELGGQAPAMLEYGISNQQAHSVGLPCGGSLTLLIENLASIAPLLQLLEQVAKGNRLERRVCLQTGEVSLHSSSGVSNTSLDTHAFRKQFGSAWRLLIAGAGELGRRVCQLALTLDYAVYVCDSRSEYAHNWSVTEANLLTTPFENIINEFKPDSRTAVLGLTHSREIETIFISHALQTDAFYVGSLGSASNSNKLKNRLLKNGLSDEQVNRLHAPVGLDLGCHQPAEIAIAIVADLVQTRNRLSAGNINAVATPA